MLGHIRHWHVAKKLTRPCGEKRLLYVEGNQNNLDAEGGISNESMESSASIDTDEQRTEIAEVLQKPESVLTRAKYAADRIKYVMNTIEKYKGEPQIQQVRGEINSWYKSMDAKLYIVITLLQKQEEWESGVLEPSAYIQSIEDYMVKVEGNERGIQMDPALNYSTSAWLSLDADTKERAKNQTEASLSSQGFGNPTEDASILVDEIQEDIKEKEGAISEFLTDLHDQDDNKNAKNLGFVGGVRRAVSNIRFVSIMDVVRAGQKYYEGLKSAWEKRAERVSAGIATGIGSALKFLPMGNEVHTELASAREQKNKEEQTQQKEFLDQNNTTFPQAVAMLNTVGTNANKFNGIMEYMAEHGWLYELDIRTRKLFGHTIPKPDGWTSEALREHLIRMQSSNSDGQESQKKRMQNVIGTADSIEPIAEFLETELKNYNYWAVYAALETAMNKGKIGESGTWITAIFLSHVRNNPEARKYIPIDIYDQLGNLGITHPAWTPTFMKVNRKELEAWQKTDDPERFQFGGDLAKAITLVEEEVAQKFGSTDAEIQARFGPNITFNRVVARVLSAQTVSDSGQTVSIFASRYTQYREAILSNDTSIDASKADDDFFGNISDAHLIGLGGIRVILRTSTRGIFENATKANGYLSNVFEIDRQLGEQGLVDAQQNFRREMKGKIDKHFVEDIKPHAATLEAWSRRTVIAVHDKKTMNVVDEFLKRGMMSQSAYRDTFGQEGGNTQRRQNNTDQTAQSGVNSLAA